MSGSCSLTTMRRSKPIAELPRREQPKERAVNLTKIDLEAVAEPKRMRFGPKSRSGHAKRPSVK